MPETDGRGDFLVQTAAQDPAHRPPDGFALVARNAIGSVYVRPGFGTAVAERPDGAIVICGSTVRRLHLVAESAASDLLDRPAPTDPKDVADHFAGVVGHFAAVVVTPRMIWTVTDHLGTIALFTESRGSASTWLTALPAADSTLDVLSVREFVATGRIAAPYTVLSGIRRQSPATVLGLAGGSTGPYWRPPPPEPSAHAGEMLRATLADLLEEVGSVRDGCTVMYSGGEDSRIIAALASRAGLDVRGIIFLDRVNREYRLAQAAARLSRVPLDVRRRRADHDAVGLEDRVRSCDPGFDLLHAHADRLVHDTDRRPILDGWFAALYKGDDVRRRRREWRGIPFGPARFVAGGVLGDRVPVQMHARWEEKAAALEHLPVQSQLEWLEYYPASDSETYGFFAFNRRRFRGLSPLALHPVVEVGARVPIGQRLNRGLYREAFGRAIGPAALVPRSDGEVLALGPRTDVAVAAVNKTAFKLFDRLTGRHAGPWQPNATRRAAADVAMERCDAYAVDEIVDVVGLPGRWADRHRVAQLALALQRVRSHG